MNDTPAEQDAGEKAVSPTLWWCSVGSLTLYAALWWLGPRYALSLAVAERPLLGVIGIYGILCGLYFVALRSALRLPPTRRLGAWIVGTSIAFRLLLLPTPPFQEIDIYRYLWDGIAITEGVDPYAWAPEAVVEALDEALEAGGEVSDPGLSRLAARARSGRAEDTVLRTIHYAHLPSPYPPVSQLVFGAAAWTTPADWSADGRLMWLKAWLVVFDIATLFVVMDLLRQTRMPVGWAVAYGWCPLVLKEVAGSGHLDAIATFLTVAAIAMAVRVLGRPPSQGYGGVAAASATLGLGVGAKLFPVVLAPLFAIAIAKRLGVARAAVGAVVFLATAIVCLAPMLAPFGKAPAPEVALGSGFDEAVVALPPPPGVTTDPESVGRTDGLAAFLQQWEMNDLLFMLVYENLRSQSEVAEAYRPWFDITPESWSQATDANAFAITRAATLALFTVIALVLAIGASRKLDGSPAGTRGWLRAAFLTLAWFWLLAPTQNPWYWCWVVPLLPWAGGRAWLAMSAMLFIYYLRFWLETHFPEPGFLGSAYNGEYFFYFVAPWLEYTPVLAWVGFEWLSSDKSPSRS